MLSSGFELLLSYSRDSDKDILLFFHFTFDFLDGIGDFSRGFLCFQFFLLDEGEMNMD